MAVTAWRSRRRTPPSPRPECDAHQTRHAASRWWSSSACPAGPPVEIDFAGPAPVATGGHEIRTIRSAPLTQRQRSGPPASRIAAPTSVFWTWPPARRLCHLQRRGYNPVHRLCLRPGPVLNQSLPTYRPPSIVVCVHRGQLPGGTSIVCHVLSFGAVWSRSDWVYRWPSGPIYVAVAGSYWAAAIGGGAEPGTGGPAAGGGEPGGSWGMPWPDSVALGSPFQLLPSLSGTYCSLLSQSFTVGARLPGTVSHGVLRAPRTLSHESCGTLQYRSPGARFG